MILYNDRERLQDVLYEYMIGEIERTIVCARTTNKHDS